MEKAGILQPAANYRLREESSVKDVKEMAIGVCGERYSGPVRIGCRRERRSERPCGGWWDIGRSMGDALEEDKG